MTLVTDWWLFPVWRTGFKIQEFPSACNPCSSWWWNSFLIVLCCTSNVHKEDFGDPGNSNIDDIHDIQKFRQIRQSFEGPWGSSPNPCTGLNIATGYFDAVPDIPLEARWVLLQESRKSSPHKKSATRKINRKGGCEAPIYTCFEIECDIEIWMLERMFLKFFATSYNSLRSYYYIILYNPPE